MELTSFQKMIFVALICWVTSYIVYFGFVSNYNHLFFSRQSFTGLYDTGVFYYRILSKFILLKLDDVVDPTHRNFYQSVFYLNAFSLILTGIVLVLLVDLKKVFAFSRSEKYFILLLVPLVINLTQFVVVPYDVLSYFFQLSILYIFLNYYKEHFYPAIIAISFILVLSTLNRESSAISISFMIVTIFGAYGYKKKDLIGVGAFVLAFLATYISVRLFLPKAPPDPQLAPFLVANFTVLVNILGVLFWILFASFAYLLAENGRNQNLILYFHLISLPYIFTVFKDGILWEVRLYIPLFLGSLFLSKLNLPIHDPAPPAHSLK